VREASPAPTNSDGVAPGRLGPPFLIPPA
jgi:hypothetical protein